MYLSNILKSNCYVLYSIAFTSTFVLVGRCRPAYFLIHFPYFKTFPPKNTKTHFYSNIGPKENPFPGKTSLSRHIKNLVSLSLLHIILASPHGKTPKSFSESTVNSLEKSVHELSQSELLCQFRLISDGVV